MTKEKWNKWVKVFQTSNQNNKDQSLLSHWNIQEKGKEVELNQGTNQEKIRVVFFFRFRSKG
jgi:hypothetical protein